MSVSIPFPFLVAAEQKGGNGEANTPYLKKSPTSTTCYNFYIHSSIAPIFGTNVAEKVGNQNVLYFPT